jgi:hypothetical protein
VTDMKERPKRKYKQYLVTDPSASWTLYCFHTLTAARKLAKDRKENGVESIIWKRV